MTTKRLATRIGKGAEETAGPVCNGSQIAFNTTKWNAEPHPRARIFWGSCWKCGRSLGCAACTTANELEVLCRKCAAWGTMAAFHFHGPIDNSEGQVAKRRMIGGAAYAPQVKDYPEGWKVGYEPAAPYRPYVPVVDLPAFPK